MGKTENRVEIVRVINVNPSYPTSNGGQIRSFYCAPIKGVQSDSVEAALGLGAGRSSLEEGEAFNARTFNQASIDLLDRIGQGTLLVVAGEAEKRTYFSKKHGEDKSSLDMLFDNTRIVDPGSLAAEISRVKQVLKLRPDWKSCLKTAADTAASMAEQVMSAITPQTPAVAAATPAQAPAAPTPDPTPTAAPAQTVPDTPATDPLDDVPF